MILSLVAVLVCSTVLQAHQYSAHTTVSSSSLVAFTVETPLRYDTTTHDSADFIRFQDISLSSEVGWPEVPSLLFLVALPDSVEPEVSWAAYGVSEAGSLPVYPAPKDSVVYDRTPAVEEFFVQDSAAYASDEWWPEEPVEVLDEMRLFDQRLLVVRVMPAAYLASDSILRTYGGFSVAVSFDSTEAVACSLGLGPFQQLVEGSPIVGYHPVVQTHATVPGVFRDFDLVDGPARVPEYVMLVADGLDGDWIDSLAWHRVETNGIDVAIVTTGEVMDEFAGIETILTDDIIREFTDAMWQWGDGSRKPSYLLLIGDHEDTSYHEAGWFLPTHEYQKPTMYEPGYANDSWYAYLNSPGEEIALPDMMVGRLSVKGADTLEVMIDNLIGMDLPIETTPLVDRRRRLVRLAGTGSEDSEYVQHYQIWKPSRDWTRSLCDWLDYDFAGHYCGDGRDWTDQDSSLSSSLQWVADCMDEFEEGAGVVFYSDHGDFHMFSAGLEWSLDYCDSSKGARDSTFNCLAADALEPDQYYAPPFVLMLCCTAGTFNHTEYQHENRSPYTELCTSCHGETIPYDFRTDCLGEAMLKNTSCPVSGVFCGSLSSLVTCYSIYGSGILESIHILGQSRLGDAIAGCRLRGYSELLLHPTSLVQFNLLGDPALDIGDRARYPDCCDLVVYPGHLEMYPYAWDIPGGSETRFSAEVRNNGGAASGAFDLSITISSGEDRDEVVIECPGLDPGESRVLGTDWTEEWFDPPIEVAVEVVADPDEECDDSWRPNNTARTEVSYNDSYPFTEGWPVEPVGVVDCPPLLINIDADPAREVVVLAGVYMEAWDTDGSRLWRGEVPLAGDIMAVDFDRDGDIEIVGLTGSGVAVFDRTGDLLDFISTGTSPVMAAADMTDATGIELVVGIGPSLYLYSWDAGSEELDLIDSKTWSPGFTPNAGSICCSDLNDDGYCEAVYQGDYTGAGQQDPSYYCIYVYDWDGDSTLSARTVGPEYGKLPPSSFQCCGMLAGDAAVGFPLGSYDPRSSYPAQLMDPLSTGTPTDCEPGDSIATRAIYGLFADWSSIIPGLDTFIVPAENQCLAWRSNGNLISGWEADFSGSDHVTSPALGDLDEDGWADVLGSTCVSGDGKVFCLDREALPLDGFPYILPPGAYVTSGFSIADIDGDEVPEIVFGTSDGLLHCWSVGECDSGYAPWPQDRGSASRAGVLE